jgi:hypothetical protein
MDDGGDDDVIDSDMAIGIERERELERMVMASVHI